MKQNIFISASVSVVLLSAMATVPAITHAQYGGGGGFFVPTVGGTGIVDRGASSSTTQTTPTKGEVLGAESFRFTLKLRLGKKGDEVKELQKFLTAKGFYKGAITGNFSIKTRTAVRAWQKSVGLKADGIIGETSRAELNK